MTVPQDYMLAQQRFDALLVDLMDALDLTTRHQVFAALYGTLRTFRLRLDAEETLIFASGLPAILRAIFVSDWRPDETMLPFADPDTYDAEARAVRANHNLMPAGSLPTVARLVRRHSDKAAFDAALAALPPEAADFWPE